MLYYLRPFIVAKYVTQAHGSQCALITAFLYLFHNRISPQTLLMEFGSKVAHLVELVSHEENEGEAFRNKEAFLVKLCDLIVQLEWNQGVSSPTLNEDVREIVGLYTSVGKYYGFTTLSHRLHDLCYPPKNQSHTPQ